MSWLDDEAKELKQSEDKARQEQELVRRSNYWAQIVACLKEEVDKINAHPVWSKKAPFGVKVVQPYGSQGWQVNYSGVKSALVEIANRPDHVEVARKFSDSSLYRNFQGSEKLHVATLGGQVVLLTGEKEPQTLVIPEDVVRYLLKGLIESLKGEDL